MFLRTTVMCPAALPDTMTLYHIVDPLTTPTAHYFHPSLGSRKVEDDDVAKVDIESLKKQMQIVDQRLATLTGRLEVLKAVQQVLPSGKPSLDQVSLFIDFAFKFFSFFV